eukprot:11185882-Lingulodinium_polyedra.AAC.1
MNTLTVLFIPVGCLMHSGQLVAKGALQVVDRWLAGRCSWRFFASLTKLIQIWRDHARAVFQCWCSLYGTAAGVEHAS